MCVWWINQQTLKKKKKSCCDCKLFCAGRTLGKVWAITFPSQRSCFLHPTMWGSGRGEKQAPNFLHLLHRIFKLVDADSSSSSSLRDSKHADLHYDAGEFLVDSELKINISNCMKGEITERYGAATLMSRSLNLLLLQWMDGCMYKFSTPNTRHN